MWKTETRGSIGGEDRLGTRQEDMDGGGKDGEARDERRQGWGRQGREEVRMGKTGRRSAKDGKTG